MESAKSIARRGTPRRRALALKSKCEETSCHTRTARADVQQVVGDAGVDHRGRDRTEDAFGAVRPPHEKACLVCFLLEL